MSSSLVLPSSLLREIGGSFDQLRSVVALTMIACGLARSSRHFVSAVGIWISLSEPLRAEFLYCLHDGGMARRSAIDARMTIVAGLVEVVFAGRCTVSNFFPPEITGLVVLMVAVGLIPLGVSKSLGINFEGEPIQGRA